MAAPINQSPSADAIASTTLLSSGCSPWRLQLEQEHSQDTPPQLRAHLLSLDAHTCNNLIDELKLCRTWLAEPHNRNHAAFQQHTGRWGFTLSEEDATATAAAWDARKKNGVGIQRGEAAERLQLWTKIALLLKKRTQLLQEVLSHSRTVACGKVHVTVKPSGTSLNHIWSSPMKMLKDAHGSAEHQQFQGQMLSSLNEWVVEMENEQANIVRLMPLPHPEGKDLPFSSFLAQAQRVHQCLKELLSVRDTLREFKKLLCVYAFLRLGRSRDSECTAPGASILSRICHAVRESSPAAAATTDRAERVPSATTPSTSTLASIADGKTEAPLNNNNNNNNNPFLHSDPNLSQPLCWDTHVATLLDWISTELRPRALQVSLKKSSTFSVGSGHRTPSSTDHLLASAGEAERVADMLSELATTLPASWGMVRDALDDLCVRLRSPRLDCRIIFMQLRIVLEHIMLRLLYPEAHQSQMDAVLECMANERDALEEGEEALPSQLLQQSQLHDEEKEDAHSEQPPQAGVTQRPDVTTVEFAMQNEMAYLLRVRLLKQTFPVGHHCLCSSTFVDLKYLLSICNMAMRWWGSPANAMLNFQREMRGVPPTGEQRVDEDAIETKGKREDQQGIIRMMEQQGIQLQQGPALEVAGSSSSSSSSSSGSGISGCAFPSPLPRSEFAAFLRPWVASSDMPRWSFRLVSVAMARFAALLVDLLKNQDAIYQQVKQQRSGVSIQKQHKGGLDSMPPRREHAPFPRPSLSHVKLSPLLGTVDQES